MSTDLMSLSARPLPDWVVPGAVFWIKEGPARRKYHVRAVVDGHAVVRWWRRRVKDWEYKVIYAWEFHIRADFIDVGPVENKK